MRRLLRAILGPFRVLCDVLFGPKLEDPEVTRARIRELYRPPVLCHRKEARPDES